MKKRNFIIFFVNAMFILLGILFFFSGHDFSAGELEQKIEIGVCYADMSNSYFEILNDEISSRIQERGDLVVVRDSMRSQKKQNEQIHRLLKDGVEALIISPVDSMEIKSALIEAKEAGVSVIIVDSPVYDKELVNSTITTDNYDVGVQLANYLMSQRTEAKVLLLSMKSSAASEERIRGFQDTLLGNDQFQIVQEETADGSVEGGMQTMEKVMEQPHFFNCVFSTNDNMAIGAIAAFDQLGVQEQCDFLCTDGSPTGKKFIKKQKIMVSAAQFPSEMGKRAVETLYKVISDEAYEQQILVPVKLITSYTINSYDMDKWQ